MWCPAASMARCPSLRCYRGGCLEWTWWKLQQQRYEAHGVPCLADEALQGNKRYEGPCQSTQLHVNFQSSRIPRHVFYSIHASITAATANRPLATLSLPSRLLPTFPQVDLLSGQMEGTLRRLQRLEEGASTTAAAAAASPRQAPAEDRLKAIEQQLAALQASQQQQQGGKGDAQTLERMGNRLSRVEVLVQNLRQ